MNESHRPSDLLSLEQLASEKCNGALSLEGHARLHELLARSSELRDVYWQICAIHADLAWDVVGASVPEWGGDCQFSDELLAHVNATVSRFERRQRGWWNIAIAAGLAAVLFSGWTLWNRGLQQAQHAATLTSDRIEAGPAAAQLKSLTLESRWSFGRPGERNPQDFRYGDTVWVDEGLVEMQLEGGTVGQLRAPVILQLVSQDRVRLLSGKIKVQAPARTNGFTVETPSAEVVDLGTEFSVEAAQTGTDLVVYGGKVDLKIPQNGEKAGEPTVTSKQFTAGQAVRVDMNGTMSRIMNVTSPADELAPASPTSSHVITSVVDNIRRDDLWAYYEVVAGGLKEDAVAFVDRFHEWNGETAAGIPSYLVGGDYVKTFNEDKITDDYQVEVTLAQPATLYVLLDTRVSPPEWLTDSFADTGDRIGVDETHHHRAQHEVTTQSGPGYSIDRTHSIWKQVVSTPQTVPLGPNGKSPSNSRWHASMYGIVALPLEQFHLLEKVEKTKSETL